MSNSDNESVPHCPLCAHQGQTEYSGLRDRMMHSSSEWTLCRCKNADCGILWLSPMPDDSQLEAAYEQYYTHTPPPSDSPIGIRRRVINSINQQYLRIRFGYPSGHNRVFSIAGLLLYLLPDKRSKLDLAVFWQTPRSTGIFLEIGFGNASTLRQLMHLGWSVKGCEYDKVAVINAREAGLEVFDGELGEWKLPANSVDVIGMSHVIEHVKAPAELIKECFRVLKPGGELIMVTPNIRSIGHRLFKEHWLNLDPPRHLHLFDLKSLSGLTHSAGFTDKQRMTTTRDASRLFCASRKIKKSGSFDMGSRYTLPERAQGLAYFTLVSLFNRLGGNCGDEIVVICTKPTKLQSSL